MAEHPEAAQRMLAYEEGKKAALARGVVQNPYLDSNPLLCLEWRAGHAACIAEAREKIEIAVAFSHGRAAADDNLPADVNPHAIGSQAHRSWNDGFFQRRAEKTTHPVLTFDALRVANVRRLPTFKNARGKPAHSEPDGSDWKLSAWMNAILGELGEAANIVKKIERGDMTLEEARPMLAKEFADIATYLDITAFRAGIALGPAVFEKFNEVSERVGSPIRMRVERSGDIAVS